MYAHNSVRKVRVSGRYGAWTASDYRQAAFDVAVDWAFSPSVGTHVGYAGGLSGEHAFQVIALGLDVGKLR